VKITLEKKYFHSNVPAYLVFKVNHLKNSSFSLNLPGSKLQFKGQNIVSFMNLTNIY
jgi:hypothetical protein